MEPPRHLRRLSNVRRVKFLVPLALIATVLLAPLPIRGQQTSAQGQGPIRLSASAGLAGFVDARRPVELAVTIAADILFAGTMEVRQGQAIIQLPVEVPAASEKTYLVRVPPPVGSVQTRIRLFEQDADNPAATSNLQLKAPQSQTVVAVVGPSEMVATIDEATVGITESEVVAAEVDYAFLERGLDPARYLVIDGARTLPDAAQDWVRQGGRVVVEPAGLGDLGLDLGAATSDGERSIYQVDRGRVIAVPAMSDLTPEGWSQIVGPTPVVLAPRDVWQSPDLQLMQAATSGGDQRIPGLPWLFAAVVGYAILVGPVNFLVLRKLGKRELAWLTVPVLSVLAVAGFWVAGRQRLQTTIVNHATFIVADDSGGIARSAVAVAAGSGGEKRVSVPEDWLAYPGSTSPELGGGMPIAPAVARTDGEGNFQFTLEQLGAAGVQAWWQPNEIRLPQITAQADGRQLEVAVDNSSGMEFWAWGIVSRGRATIAPGSLAAGSTGNARVLPGQAGMNEFGSVADAVINARQLWNDQFIWARLSPLAYGASVALDEHDSYFFGFTTELTIPIGLDGRTVSVTGESLVLIPIDLTQAGMEELSSTTARLLDTGNASWIDWGPGYLSISSEEMTVGWDLESAPVGNPTLEVSNIFGEIPRSLDVYNWTTSSYDEVGNHGELDLTQYRNALGEVMVRARASEDEDQFMEFPMSPYAFTLEWGS
jgi:hypothetical protein